MSAPEIHANAVYGHHKTLLHRWYFCIGIGGTTLYTLCHVSTSTEVHRYELCPKSWPHSSSSFHLDRVCVKATTIPCDPKVLGRPFWNMLRQAARWVKLFLLLTFISDLQDMLLMQCEDDTERCWHQQLDVVSQDCRHIQKPEHARTALAGLPHQTTPDRGLTPAAEHPLSGVAPA